jgi:hypothetical protein
VDALDVADVERALGVLGHLGRAHLDDSRRRPRVGLRGLETLDRPRLRHGT